MRSGLFVTGLMLVLLLAGCPAVEPTETVDHVEAERYPGPDVSEKRVPLDPDEEAVRVGIARVECLTSCGRRARFNDLLVHALTMSTDFLVVERPHARWSLDQERRLREREPDSELADWLLKVTITRYRTTRERPPFVDIHVADVATTIRVVDVETGRILNSVRAEGKATSHRQTFLFRSRQFEHPIEPAILAMMKEAVAAIEQ